MQRRPAELRELLARTEQEQPIATEQYLSFHALTDPRGKRFVAVRWFFPRSESMPKQQWVVAQGYFEQLEAKMDAFLLAGGSASGEKSGTISVSYQDCQTAMFIYQPDGAGLPKYFKTAPIDPKIWKYCS
jgi:hypothetical protein